MEKISQLTHDIAFAAFRVASLISHRYLREEVERAATSVAAYPEGENLASLERIITLAHSVGETSVLNKEVLIREIDNLRDLIDSEAFPDIDAIDVSHIFENDSDEGDNAQNGGKRKQTEMETESKRQTAMLDFQYDISGNLSPSKRQTAIADYIQQFPDGCQLKDLNEQFDVSKRTLRNDINALIKAGVIKRSGKGGPHSYYIYTGEGAVGERAPDEDKAPKSLDEANRELDMDEDGVIYLSEPLSEYIN